VLLLLRVLVPVVILRVLVMLGLSGVLHLGLGRRLLLGLGDTL